MRAAAWPRRLVSSRFVSSVKLAEIEASEIVKLSVFPVAARSSLVAGFVRPVVVFSFVCLFAIARHHLVSFACRLGFGLNFAQPAASFLCVLKVQKRAKLAAHKHCALVPLANFLRFLR